VPAGGRHLGGEFVLKHAGDLDYVANEWNTPAEDLAAIYHRTGRTGVTADDISNCMRLGFLGITANRVRAALWSKHVRRNAAERRGTHRQAYLWIWRRSWPAKCCLATPKTCVRLPRTEATPGPMLNLATGFSACVRCAQSPLLIQNLQNYYLGGM